MMGFMLSLVGVVVVVVVETNTRYGGGGGGGGNSVTFSLFPSFLRVYWKESHYQGTKEGRKHFAQGNKTLERGKTRTLKEKEKEEEEEEDGGGVGWRW
ncbi:hypothetical protein M0804_003512 [Polistes exclamans]|nr:hypothetical protein M0804_003512 [Polistes exclamans]